MEEAGFDMREVEREVMLETEFFPKTGEGGGGSTKNLRVRGGFLAELGKVFHGDFLFRRAVLVEVFELDEVLGSIEIEEGARVGGREIVAVERGEEAAGATLVFLENGGQLDRSGG